VACVTDDRVLVKDQATASENGIYVVDTGAWARAKDFDGSYDVVKGTMVRVTDGATLSDSYWAVSTANPITIGTSSITWTQVNNALVGVSAFVATLLDDADATTFLATLGLTISAFIKTLLDDANAATARATVGAVGLTGNETIAGVKTLSDIPVLSGGGVSFPATQVPSANANTLDDYEEGVWTPSLGGTTTYTTQVGTYTKIGRVVFIEAELVINAIGTGSTATISGLPFTSKTSVREVPVRAFTSATAIVSIVGQIAASNTTIALVSRTAANADDATNAIFQNGTNVYLSGFYHV